MYLQEAIWGETVGNYIYLLCYRAGHASTLANCRTAPEYTGEMFTLRDFGENTAKRA
jgi:hypothetical protein